MSKKIKSLWFVFVMYVITISIGLIVFHLLNIESFVLKVLIANIVGTIWIYIIGILINNSSLYDPYWSVIPPVILIFSSLYFKTLFNLPVFLLNLGVLVWSIRLTYNWILTWTGFDYVDWRYVMIREKTKRIWALSNFFGIHLFPTLIVYIQLIAAIYFIENADAVNWITILGLLIILCATTIQFISDKQLRDFKENRQKSERIINVGLWKFSRHPNYFGEVLVWFGVYTFYFSIIQKIDFYLLMPVLMLFMFVFISIPMMEKKILKTRPEYKTYQENVSMLLMLPHKNKAKESFNFND